MMFKHKRDKIEEKHDARVEVVVHKEANKVAVKEAQEQASVLSKVLTENGFSLQFFYAVGGKNNNKPKKIGSS